METKVRNLRFTVVTVTFNAEKAITRTVKSVLEQTYAPYEYLIFDGKSSDSTVSIAEQFRTEFEKKGIRLSIISEKDSGIYNAMNKGVKAATGDFVSFLNAGDWYEPEALATVNSLYQERKFDLAYGGLNYINPNGSITKKMSKYDKYLITSRHWNHPSMFLRRQIYQKYGFDERFRTYADFHLYTKLRKKRIRIRIIPAVITNFSADGVSTDVRIRKVIGRGREKYQIYRDNGYSPLYFFEAYGWELLKSLYFRIHS